MMDAETREPQPVDPDAPDEYRDNPDPDAPVSDPADNSPDEDDEPRGLFEQFADDLDAGRITEGDAVRRLVRGLAAQERGESDDDVRAAFYPGESDEQ